MNRIKRKLGSRSGATVILALVFLLFCMFVGGSVLAAGAANGFRTKQVDTQQAQLEQRSAANFIRQELEGSGTALQLTITDITQTKTACSVMGVTSGSVYSTDRQILARFSEPTELTGMQRLAVEAAIWQYLKQSGITDTTIVRLENVSDLEGVANFYTQYTLTANPDIQGSMTIDGTAGGSSFAGTEATFVCREGAELYDFAVSLGTEESVTVELEATSHTNGDTGILVGADSSSSTGYAKTVTTTSQTVILWDAPTVRKGG